MSNIQPVSVDYGHNAKPEPRKSSSRESGIQEHISENYEDDDFEIEESLPKQGSTKNQNDFFNQNKNFSGGLKGLGDAEKEKDSDPSGLGFDDNYNIDFF